MSACDYRWKLGDHSFNWLHPRHSTSRHEMGAVMADQVLHSFHHFPSVSGAARGQARQHEVKHRLGAMALVEVCVVAIQGRLRRRQRFEVQRLLHVRDLNAQRHSNGHSHQHRHKRATGISQHTGESLQQRIHDHP